MGVSDPKKCAGIILGETGLADDTFRLGNTKARNQYFKHYIFDFFINLIALPLQLLLLQNQKEKKENIEKRVMYRCFSMLSSNQAEIAFNQHSTGL